MTPQQREALRTAVKACRAARHALNCAGYELLYAPNVEAAETEAGLACYCLEAMAETIARSVRQVQRGMLAGERGTTGTRKGA